MTDQGGDHPVLNRSKTGKTIQHKGAASYPFGGGDRLGQKFQHLFIGDKTVPLGLHKSCVKGLKII